MSNEVVVPDGMVRHVRWHYREVWVEKPGRHIVLFGANHTEIYNLPMPYIRYELSRMNNRTYSHDYKYWHISSVRMKAYEYSKTPSPVVVACLPNLDSYGVPCMPDNSAEDRVILLNRFWETRFNNELHSYKRQPVWKAMARKLNVSYQNWHLIFQYWESLTVRQFQNLCKEASTSISP